MANEPTKAELQERLAASEKLTTDLEARVARLTTDLTTANERGDQERQRAGTAEARVTELEAETRKLAGSLKAYKGSATKLRAEAEVLKRDLSPEARSVGAPKPPKNDEEAADRAARLEAALRDGPVELVFSDGRREIRELAPLLVTGDAWRVTPRGRVLEAMPMLEPGTIAKPELRVAGIGLLNGDGEQVGWRKLPETILVASGTRVQLPKGTILF